MNNQALIGKLLCIEGVATQDDSTTAKLLANDLRRTLENEPNTSRQDDVIKELCEIGGIIGKFHNNQYAYDCFCVDSASNRDHILHFQYEDYIINFIRQAVNEKIERLGLPVSRWEKD